MPSPFPGMDPYLEDPAVWLDFHESFITYCRDAIIANLPDQYDARIEERITLERISDAEAQLFRADVAVSTASGKPSERPQTAARGGVLTLEPVTVPLLILDEIHESQVHIVRRADRKLVTVVELLSPTNKSGDGKHEYRAKRNALLRTRVNLVEIDLLVGGERPPFRRPHPNHHYCVFVSRGNQRPDCDVFTWSVREPLPTIPIPLEAPDPDMILDLADLFRIAYERGRYERSLHYTEQPGAPLDAGTLGWARDLLKRTRPLQPGTDDHA